ncbi:MAG: hypothetical protein ACREPT_05000 [Rudaea sp.]
MSCDFTTLFKVQGDPEAAMDVLQQCTEALLDPTTWYWAIAFTIVCALVGALIGKYKNAVVRDTVLGLALGPIGWIISLLLPATKPKPACPACKRVVEAGDAHCRYCGAALKPAAPR